MPRLELNHDDGFATGACRYEDSPQDEPQSRRIVIPLRLADDANITRAVVDTGAPWSVLNPDRAEKLQNYSMEYRDLRILIRGMNYRGDIWRIPVEMIAHEGQGFRFEASVFVPKFRSEFDTWNLPEFVGLQGFLDRIRFAVDPEENLFYFGALGDA